MRTKTSTITPCFYVSTVLDGPHENAEHPEWAYRIIILRKGQKAKLLTSGQDIQINSPSVLFASPEFKFSLEFYEDSPVREYEAIRFPKSTIPEELIQQSYFQTAARIINLADRGILCGKATTNTIAELLETAEDSDGLESFILLMKILEAVIEDEDRKIIASDLPLSVPVNELSYSRRIKACVNYLEENYRKQITLNDLAGIACMTKESTCRFFKKELGETLGSMLRKIRVRNAGYMLAQSDKAISTVATECGFNNIAYFNRVFRGMTGLTPGKFREKYQSLNYQPKDSGLAKK